MSTPPGPSCCRGPGPPPDRWGAADITLLTFLDEEALARQPQGVLIQLDSDGCLLVLVGLGQPEGLVQEQVLQAVMGEAWGSGQPRSQRTLGVCREALTAQRWPSPGGWPPLPLGSRCCLPPEPGHGAGPSACERTRHGGSGLVTSSRTVRSSSVTWDKSVPGDRDTGRVGTAPLWGRRHCQRSLTSQPSGGDGAARFPRRGA